MAVANGACTYLVTTQRRLDQVFWVPTTQQGLQPVLKHPRHGLVVVAIGDLFRVSPYSYIYGAVWHVQLATPAAG